MDTRLFDAEIVTTGACDQVSAHSRCVFTAPRLIILNDSLLTYLYHVFLQPLVKSKTFPISQKHVSHRRTRITDRPQVSLSLWSIMRNCIGKELTKIPMPVGDALVIRIYV